VTDRKTDSIEMSSFARLLKIRSSEPNAWLGMGQHGIDPDESVADFCRVLLASGECGRPMSRESCETVISVADGTASTSQARKWTRV
jgi:hypothetical protein